MNFKNKELKNLSIGLLLILLGFFLSKSKNNYWHYLGLLMLIYGVFVAVVKIIKILYLSEGKYKNIWRFEENEQLNIKGYLKEVLEFRIKNSKEVTFEVPHFGLFRILDYNDVNVDNYRNPQKLKEEINEFLENFCYPMYTFKNIIPIAINNNHAVLFLADNNHDIVYFSLDDSNFKPLILKNSLEYYLDIKKLKILNDTYYYDGLLKVEDILPRNKFFYDVPDCIFEGKDYVDIIRKCFDLLDEKIDYSISNIMDFENLITFELRVENRVYKNHFDKSFNNIDSDKLVIVLNEILCLLKYNSETKFCLISNRYCGFGVLLTDNANFDKLKDNGCVTFDYESQKFSKEEIERRNKYSDFKSEIENIAFYIKVAKESNQEPLKKGAQYHLSYPIRYAFNAEELNIIKEKLNIVIVKKETEYEIFFNN